jgi:hypothetical protein
MAEGSTKRECIDCGKEIGDSEKFLVVGDKDGRKQFVHTLCFTNTTFDPERYQQVSDPDSTE